MNAQKFYSILDEEIIKILDENQDDKELHKHKNVDQNKGYALLIWFLKFYGQTLSFKQYITEGPDDGACDIIFSNKDSQGQVVFYVVQSKWVSRKEGKSYPCIDKEEFNAVLSDFSSVLSADKPKKGNEKFNQKYDELISHLQANGKAKFIFFTLSKYNDEIVGNIKSFNKAHQPNVTLEVIDIEKIKRDYIEFNFKGISTANPLEYKYDPEDVAIDLQIERGAIESANGRDFLEFDGRDKAFIFILKPRVIHDLFSKYKFSLFFKNVRNPLHKSNYNEKIVKTLIDRPSAFWYFNNGITAITKIIPAIGAHANSIKLQGLQIINGAQTVYSIYTAYENATEKQRVIMDADARITFRLIKSSDENFNLDITRYNNFQNRILDRDFVSNYDEQQKIQNESFETDIWYEKRRDEFVVDKSQLGSMGVMYISNQIFAFAYLAFWLQKPVDCITHSDNFFVKKADSSDGLYEVIFNSETTFKKMLSAYYVWMFILDTYATEDDEGERFVSSVMADFLTPILSLSKVALEQVLRNKYSQDLNVTEFLIKHFAVAVRPKEKDAPKAESEEYNLITQVVSYCSGYLYNKLTFPVKGRGVELSDEASETFGKLMTDEAYYNVLKHELEGKNLTVADLSVPIKKRRASKKKADNTSQEK